MYQLLPDVIVQRAGPDAWVMYNVFSRTAVAAETSALAFIDAVVEGAPAPSGQDFRVWDIERFSNEDGLLADPTRMIREIADWPAARAVPAAALIELLEARNVLCSDEAAYRERFAAKTNLVDTKRFGNFHQQLGQHLLVNRRQDPDAWWLNQKFTADMSAIRDNLYGTVQGRYLERFFGERLGGDEAVLDLGCGPGFFTRLMAKSCRSVLGLDPNDAFIRLAAAGAPDNAEFAVAEVGADGGLDHLADESFDVVFMSDALLFYFVPAAPDQVADIDQLLGDVRRILKPSGRFISVEPHNTYWLAPWLGAPDRPFTVLTEYLERDFLVTPTHRDFVQAFARNGFAVTWMDELAPPDGGRETADRGSQFARAFPLWQLYEFQPMPSGSEA